MQAVLMAQIKDWCASTNTAVNPHSVAYLEAESAKLSTGVANLAAILPSHYADSRRIARILDRLGKPKAAKYVEAKLPIGVRSRSGDVGEILASSWVNEFTDFKAVIVKLRWKDHREMPMRGDDVLAVSLDPKVAILFLKGEVKSRAALTKRAVEDARVGLRSSEGRPTPHALAFVSDRLAEVGEVELSDLIDKAQLTKRIELKQMSHLMFVFTGNNPVKLLVADLEQYKGKIKQYSVGLRVASHQQFIEQVFDKVIADGNAP